MKMHAATQETHDQIIAAMKVVGNCVKSWESLTGDGQVCGRLLLYDEARDIVYIAGQRQLHPGYEWKGTVEEYFETWTVD